MFNDGRELLQILGKGKNLPAKAQVQGICTINVIRASERGEVSERIGAWSG